jgi:hypothetical protein
MQRLGIDLGFVNYEGHATEESNHCHKEVCLSANREVQRAGRNATACLAEFVETGVVCRAPRVKTAGSHLGARQFSDVKLNFLTGS